MRKIIMDRLRALRDGGEAVGSEIDEELRFHIDMRADEYVRRGVSPERARREAEKQFGHLAGIRELGYEVRGGGRLETVWQDLRYGARGLRKNPSFTLVAVVTLALGVGATTTMYSVLYNVMLNPFPYADAGRIEDILIRDLENPRGGERGALTVPEFLDYQEQSQVFEEVIGSTHEPLLLTTDEGVENFSVAWVTPNAFRFLGVAPLLGRVIDPVDGRIGAPPVAVISHKAWVNRFGGDANVLGRTIVLGDISYTVIGVMPPRFAWHLGDAWLPSPLDRADPKASTKRRWFQGRLKPGITREQATAELNLVCLALGASGRNVVWLVLRQGLRLVLVGIVLGLTIAALCSRLALSYFDGLDRTDPAAVAIAASLLLLVALLACYLPARRATKVDPVITLRQG